MNITHNCSKITLAASFCWLMLLVASAPAAVVVWNAASPADIGTAANWTGGVLPSAATPDVAQWNNTPSGPLSLTYTNPTLGGAAGNAGILLNMTAAQTGSLSIQEGANTTAMRISGISLASGAGAFTLGQSSGTFAITLGGAAGTQSFTNNSANTATFNSDVVLGTGGGGPHVISLVGTGSWIFDNVIGNSSGSIALTQAGTGTTTLAAANTYTGATTLSAGTLQLQNASALASSALTMASGATLSLEANANTTFAPASMAFSGSGSPTYNFYVNNISSGSGNTLILGDFPNTPPSTTDTINLTGGDNYTLQIGANAAGTTAVQSYNTTTWNAASGTTLSMPGGITIAYGAAYTMGFGGAGNINLGALTPSGTFAITVNKAGAGTLTLSGSAALGTGTLSVSGGTLALTGSAALTSTTSSFLIGTVSGTPAAVYQSGASSSITAKPTGGGWQLGSVPGAYGYYNLSAGTITIANGGELDPAGSGGGAGTFGQFDMSGGTVNVGTSGTGDTYFLPCRGATGESSVVNLSSGTFTIFNGMPDGTYGGYEANWAAGSQTNVTTISGSAVFQSLSSSVKLNWANNAGNVGILNLNGGTWQMQGLNNSQNANVRVNMNGGTVEAGNLANTTFLGNSAAAYVFGGGARVNNNGLAITISQPLLAPAGNGVTTIPVSAGGAGYVMPPQVLITGGGGSNATAYAAISGGAVTGITLTSPGNNYSSTPTVTLVGGGYTSAATLGTVMTAANVSGGLTAAGSGTLTLGGANTYTGATVVSNGSFVVVSGSLAALNKEGNGTLTLNAANPAVTTATIVGVGTLALGAGGSLNNTPSITVSNNATYDVSTVTGGYTLLGSQSLYGSGTNNGSVSTASGSMIYAGTASGYGTNTFNNNLTLVSGAVANFNLTTNYNGTNGFINVGGSLTDNGSVSVSAPSTSVNLDTNADYVLITAAGGVSGSVSATPLWGIKPLNWRNFTVIQSGNNIQLHYVSSTPPIATGTASPATAVGNQNVLISVTVTPGTGTVDPNTGVTLDASQLGLSTSVPLVNSTGNVYTNTITISAAVLAGAYTLNATITDSTPLTGSTGVGLTVVVTNVVWSGGGNGNFSDNSDWISTMAPSFVGDSLTFAGTTGLTPTVDQNYTVSGITFSNTAGSFNIGTSGNPLTLTNSSLIVNNSANAQTLNVPIADNGGGLTYSGGGNLTLAAVNTYTGPTVVNGGTLNVSGTVASTNTTTVGNAATNAELVISGSGSLTQNHLFVGNANGAVGAVYQTGGTVTATAGTGGDLMAIGNILGGYGYYDALGGSVTASGLAVGGENNTGTGFTGTGGNGIMEINGGTVNDSGYFVMARGATNEIGILNVFSGGTLNYAGGGLVNCWGTGQTAIVNILGGLVENTSSVGFNLNQSGNLTNTSILNLNGGVAQASGFVGSAGALVNFNGGTLEAYIANTSFMSGLAGVNVYSGGATINDDGNTIAINQAFLAPTGNGVAGTLTSGGAGYIAPPIIIVVPGSGDTTGKGASAIAQINPTTGSVTNVIVTSPGVNYTATPTFVVSGGGATSPAVITGSLAANTSGGLTKTGSGMVTLGGFSTYTGNTVINGGTLQLSEPVLHMTFDNVSGTTVYNQGSGGSAMNGTLTGAATIVSGGRFGNALSIPSGGSTANYVLVSSGVVPFNNSGTWSVGVWVKTATAGACYLYQGDGAWASGDTSLYLNSGTTTAGTHAGGVRYGQGWETGTAAVNDGNWHFVVMTCNAGVKAQYVDGAMDALTVNGWTGNGTATQLRIGGTADTGDGNVALNGLIDEVYIYNRALSQAEILQLYGNNNPQVLPTNTTVNVTSGNTFDVGGLSQQIGALAGSGGVTLDDVVGAPGTLVLGNANNTEFDGVISDNSGAGALTKVGSGTVLLTGSSSFSGTTIVSNGTLLVNGSLNGPVTVASGGNLGGLGTLNGATMVYGSLTAGSNSVLGQIIFENNLVFAPSGIASFSLTTSASGVNDQAIVHGSVTGSNNVIHISAPSPSANLDTADYVLIDNSPGSGITGGFQSTPVWNVRPLNYQNYTIQNNGSSQIVLHYSVATAPTATIAVSANPVTRNQGSLITVTVTPGSPGTIGSGSVTLDDSAFGGSATLPLNEVGLTDVYTNTIAAPASYAPGAYTFVATVTDSLSLQAAASTNLTLTIGNDIWSGAGSLNFSDNNDWVNDAAPGYVGDSLVFAGSAGLAPALDQNYTVTSVTFSNNAGSFNIGTSGNTLTLTNSSSVVDNSTNTETLNVPVVFTTAGALNANTGNLVLGGTVDNGGLALTVSGTANTTISGNISDAGGLIKSGTGTLVLGGNNSYAGTTTVNGGSLAVTNVNSLTNSMLVADGSLVLTNAGIINVSAATFSAGNVIPPNLVIGSTANQNGAFYQSAGTTINITNVNLGAFAVGSTTNDYGYYNLSGGTVNLGGEISVAGPAGGSGTFGQLDMSSGVINLPNSTATYFLANRGAVGESSVVNLSGGTVQIAGGGTPADNGINGLVISWGGGQQTNVTTISGSAQFLTPSVRVKLNEGTSYNGLGVGGSNNVTTLNLNGGTLQTLGFLNGTANPRVNLNFNGGTLMAGTAANTSFLANLGGAYIYGGGAIIDDNSKTITIGQALLAPAGKGVTSIAVATSGAGYLVPPQVTITDASGSNATAYATIAGGVVTSITLSSPGSGYSSSPTVTLVGGGYATAATVGAITTTANVSGGLTKQNTGTLTLTGASTYTGNTVINAGTLALGAGGSIGNSANINVTSGATFDVSAVGIAVNSGQTLEGNGTVNGSVTNNGTVLPGVPGSLGALTFNNNLTLQSSGNASVKLNKTLSPAATNDTLIVSGAANYGGTLTVNNLVGTLALGDQFKLFSASSYSGNFASVSGSPGTGLAYSFNPASGVLSVVTGIASYSTNITATVSGSTLAISWPSTHLGWILQSQTNSLSTGLGTNWVDVPNTASVTSTNETINPANPTVFYRLRQP